MCPASTLAGSSPENKGRRPQGKSGGVEGNGQQFISVPYISHGNCVEASANTDLMAEAISCLRPHLDRSKSIHVRVQAFWFGAKETRHLAARDKWRSEFLRLARGPVYNF